MHVQVFVPIALKPQAMLQSTVQGAWLLASVVVQLGSIDEPVFPPALLVAVPAAPEPAVPEDSPPAPVPELPLPPLVMGPELPVEVVEEDVPLDPALFTPWFPAPLSVLLEQPEGAQR